MTGRRQIWTREGRVDLRPYTSKIAVQREDRVMAWIAEYVQSLPVEIRKATEAVYVRAYRTIGWLPGSPNDIDTALPPEPKPPPTGEPEHAVKAP